MSILTASIKITGIAPVLFNNPQTVDRFHPLTKRMAAINAKKTRRTDDDYLELRNLEMEAKIYWDDDLGIYVPATWVTSAIAANAFRVCKVSKADVRGCVFPTEAKLKLHYRGMEKVKKADDVIYNPDFRHMMTLKQQASRVVKAMPIFHKWWFETALEFDDKMIDPASLARTIEHAAKFGGFGDFRPTFGRAVAEVTHV